MRGSRLTKEPDEPCSNHSRCSLLFTFELNLRYASLYSTFNFWQIAGQVEVFSLGKATDLKKEKYRIQLLLQRCINRSTNFRVLLFKEGVTAS